MLPCWRLLRRLFLLACCYANQLGGFVSYLGCWRAMGILAMSRALGDLFLKPYVSAEPDVMKLALAPTDEFVILASDGVYDVFDNEQVVRIARSAGSPQEAANLLTSSACKRPLPSLPIWHVPVSRPLAAAR